MNFQHTNKAPAAIGPYSQAVSVDGWLYTSGQIALDPKTEEMIDGDFAAQSQRVLDNLRAVLATVGCNFSHVVKATVFVTDMGNFPTLNELYGEAMGDNRPARSTIEVSALPKGPASI
jgi:2-iminobutanoate/2-iminopropanoate deaminase